MRSHGPSGPGGDPRFDRMDRNGDGRISHDEYMTVAREHAEKLFNTIDVQHRGFITLEDIRAARDAMMSRRGRQAPAGGPWRYLEDNFAVIDANRDGRITRDEFLADATARAEKSFARLDANGDGYITRDEYKAARDKIQQRQSRQIQDMDPMNQ